MWSLLLFHIPLMSLKIKITQSFAKNFYLFLDT